MPNEFTEYNKWFELQPGQCISFPSGPCIVNCRCKSGSKYSFKNPDDFIKVYDHDGSLLGTNWPHPKDRSRQDYVTHLMIENI